MEPETETSRPWYVYIVRCRDESLYTGITTDVGRRVMEHNHETNGARYTRPRRPVRLVYQEQAPSRSAALKQEARIKRLRAPAKKRLIAAQPAGGNKGVTFSDAESDNRP
ncbi:MAG: GIY-YIG nuclease family protein [Desulfobacterales bacterium]|nr:GIY-YIG nuclease family protein [Desulfobacterales bacterium]